MRTFLPAYPAHYPLMGLLWGPEVGSWPEEMKNPKADLQLLRWRAK